MLAACPELERDYIHAARKAGVILVTKRVDIVGIPERRRTDEETAHQQIGNGQAHAREPRRAGTSAEFGEILP